MFVYHYSTVLEQLQTIAVLTTTSQDLITLVAEKSRTWQINAWTSALTIKDQTAYNKEVYELVAKTANYEDQYIGKRTEAKQSYKPKYHGNNGVNRVKYTDQYTNVTRPLTPPQNLLASTYAPQSSVANNTVPTSSANVIEQIKNQNSQFFHNMSTNLHPGPTENYYQLFPNKSQVQAEKPSVTFAPSNQITTTAEIHTKFLNNQSNYSN